MINNTSLTYKTEPYAHQRAAVENTIEKPCFGLFMEQGTGKTKIILDTYRNLWEDGTVHGLLILAPNGVHANWIREEVPKHLDVPDGTELRTLVWKSGRTKTQMRKLDFICSVIKERPLPEPPPEDMAILTMNIEAIRTEHGFNAAIRFLRAGPCMLVVDESTVIKNIKAKQTKQALALAELAKYRRVLTGTPITQGPLDLYPQILFLSRDIWPYGSFTAYKNDFCVEHTTIMSGNRRFNTIVGYRNLEKLSEIIKPHVLQIKKKDCLDLPDKVYETRDVELTSEQAKHYDSLKELALTQLDNGDLATADMTLKLLLRLHQITCGHLVGDDGTCQPLLTNRIMAMHDIIADTDDQVIIWAIYKDDIRRIGVSLEEKYGPDSYALYYGDVNQNDRQKAIRDFQAGHKRFFVANSAAWRGLTLHAASTVIYYSNSYSWDGRAQSEDRCHRIGQEKTVVYHDLVARETVDERIIEALHNKKNLASLIMKGVVSIKDLL